MPFEKIMQRSGGPKGATDVWVIWFWNFKTVYYLYRRVLAHADADANVDAPAELLSGKKC